jgi:hypothetical protein
MQNVIGGAPGQFHFTLEITGVDGAVREVQMVGHVIEGPDEQPTTLEEVDNVSNPRHDGA